MALLASCALVAGLQLPAFAQETHQFDVRAAEPAAAIRAFGEQSGTQILVAADSLNRGTLKPVVGELPTDQALQQLLEGSGLEHRYVGERTIALVRPEESSTAHVINGETDNSRAVSGDRAQQDSDAAANTGERREERAQNNSRQPDSTSTARMVIEEVVVTGTNIRGVKDVAAPLTTITRKEIDQMGVQSVENLMAKVPSNFNALNKLGNNFGSQGTSRLAASNQSRTTGIDLRGLGVESTLTLLNGKRIAGSVNGRVSDVSAIPLPMIERVEIASGGRSAIYGSDAVAGVVNITTRRSFAGAQSFVSIGQGRAGANRLDLTQIGGIERQNGGFVLAGNYAREEPLELVRRGLVLNPSVSYGTLFRTDATAESQRASFMGAGRVRVSDRTALSFDGLYASNTSNTVQLFRLDGALQDSSTTTQNESGNYQLSAGAAIDLPLGWHLDAALLTGSADETYSGRFIQNFADFGFDGDFRDDSQFRLSSGSVVATGQLFEIGGVVPRVALGAEIRRETLDRNLEFSGTVFFDYELDRTNKSVFAEVVVPLLAEGASGGPRLELSGALRSDHYSDFGATTNPQVGVIVAPFNGLTLKAAYSSSFRAPSLFDLAATNSLQLNNFADPLSASPDGTSPVLMISGRQPDLGPERGKTWTAGIDIAPTSVPGFRASASYFRINYRERLDIPTLGSIPLVLVQSESFAALTIRNPSASQLATIIAENNSSGIIDDTTGRGWDQTTPILESFPDLVVFDNRFANIASEAVRGIDLASSVQLEAGRGVFTASVNATKLFRHGRRVTSTSPSVSQINVVGRPMDFRLRGNLGYESGPIGVFATINYYDSYENPVTAPVSEIGSWSTLDLSIRFEGSRLTRSGALSGLSASLSVDNVFDSDPPFFENPIGATLFDAANGDPRGRFVTVSVAKKW